MNNSEMSERVAIIKPHLGDQFYLFGRSHSKPAEIAI